MLFLLFTKTRLKTSEKYLKCAACSKIFHIECLHIDRIQLKSIDENNWFCTGSCSTVVDQNENNSTDESNINAGFTELNEEHSLNDIVKSINYMPYHLDALVKGNRALRDLTAKYQHLEKRVQVMELELESLRQQRNDSILLVTGIPVKLHENVKSTITSVVSKLNIQLNEDTFYDVSRIEKHSSDENNYPPPIIVKFSSSMYVSKIFKAKKELGQIFVKQLYEGHDNDGDVINFRSFMTQYNCNLLNQAKTLKNSGFKYVWFSDNVIKVRKDSNSKVYLIRSEADINTIKEKFVNK